MPGERDAENLRVALMSYDDRELRIRKFYLEEQSTIIRCTCFQSGEPVLQALRQERCFDVLVLSSQLGWELALLPRTPQGVRVELTLPLPTRPFPIETTVEFRSQPSHPDEHSTTALQHQLRRELYLLTRRHAGN